VSGKLRSIVLATGTEIGKTYVSSALLRRARSRGLSVCAVKPVMSGFSDAALEASDAGQLAAACGDAASAQTLPRYCRFSFEEALAPNVAARRAGVEVRFDDLVDFVRRAFAADADFSLAEGAGGVLSPVTDTHLNVDLATALNLPVVMATANYLGAVTHTLTALEACERRGARVAALAVSRPSAAYGAPEEIADELRRWSDIPAACFPHAPADDPAEGPAEGPSAAAADLIIERLSGLSACAP